jgi:hypothetical protein
VKEHIRRDKVALPADVTVGGFLKSASPGQFFFWGDVTARFIRFVNIHPAAESCEVTLLSGV